MYFVKTSEGLETKMSFTSLKISTKRGTTLPRFIFIEAAVVGVFGMPAGMWRAPGGIGSGRGTGVFSCNLVTRRFTLTV